ncbi:hypothetical protein B0T16DRAFT_491562 [Cercophora newfieldiana]|uniref:Uncharacterized protein n=1 Tax=Cercophora newfieldiana TaxID=92897 RepID=A0AA39YAP3_9PEZI|nr:hypothetical protein B0T16DRAFT_491562 [Cercophora newfieldiana]
MGRICADCGRDLPQTSYTGNQWSKGYSQKHPIPNRNKRLERRKNLASPRAAADDLQEIRRNLAWYENGVGHYHCTNPICNI